MRILNLALAAIAAAAFALAAPAASAAQNNDNDTYSRNEIVQAVSDFFGVTTEAAAKAVEYVFRKHGRPNGYIVGSEGSGAVVIGVRYGEGDLYFKHRRRGVKVYWQGPSVGFDVGANASKCFTLVYNLPNEEKLFQRYPGVEGTYYFIAGIGINYQQSGRTILAPMRTGVGVRAGVNAGYLSYSRERSWVPL